MNTLLKTMTCAAAALAAMISLASGCLAQTAVLQQESATLQGSGTRLQESTAANPAGLMDPTKATEQAPAEFTALFQTSKGDFKIAVKRAWAPNGADRFYNMIQTGYFDSDIAIFRAIEGFMFQFGIHGDPAVSAKWSESNIQDDPFAGNSNTTGRLSFAQTGRPNSRSIQMFVNLGNNSRLDQTPFVPFGEITEGLDVVKKIYTKYGENPRGENIQGQFKENGNAYIFKRFPSIDMIKKVSIVK
ncbi:MAG: peptidyl-prolyl cis-trans isomerase A (cyclophilin A) [Mariniblastus sp.]|jgi:peptidyl-prolyl cis-trans isomerase A (cyclophilin A)